MNDEEVAKVMGGNMMKLFKVTVTTLRLHA